MNDEKRLLQVPSAHVTDGREAQPLAWYAAYTRVHSERKAASHIGQLGIEAYVPLQKEWRQWSDRRKLIERVVTPLMVFVHCAPRDTLQVEKLSLITRFLRVPGERTRAVIPDHQMQTFRFAIDRAESAIVINPPCLRVGDAVKVCYGPLAGLEGRVAYTREGEPMVIITIDYLGCAGVHVNKSDLMLLPHA